MFWKVLAVWTQILFVSVRAEREPLFNFLSPSYASVSTENELVLEYEIFHFLIPEDGFLLLDSNKKSSKAFKIDRGVECNVATDGLKYCKGTISMWNIESGTHVINVELVKHSGEKVTTRNEYPHIVLERIPRIWEPKATKLTTSADVDITIRKSLLKSQANQNGNLANKKISVVFIGTLGYDGQKSIWKAQFEHLEPHYDINYVTFSNAASEPEPFVDVLHKNNIFLQRTALTFTQNVFDKVKSVDSAMDVLLKRLSKMQSFNLGASPRKNVCRKLLWELLHLFIDGWGLDAALGMFGALSGYDVAVYANSQLPSDKVLAKMCSLAGASAVVVDLPNLFPMVDIETTSAVVAPSHYAALHESVLNSLNVNQNIFSHYKDGKTDQESIYETTEMGFTTRHNLLVVIHPGINTSIFRPFNQEDAVSESVICEETKRPYIGTFSDNGSNKSSKVVIGYVGRLSPEKSPGDGEIMKGLRFMAKKMRVAIEFKGAVYNDLPRHLAEFDVLVNPSLRSTSETFCIVNIEAMSMGIPVVSFGAGGIMDYLRNEENGVLVKTVSGKGLASGVMNLFHNDISNLSFMKQNAREIVVRKFELLDMVMRYDLLYKHLYVKFGMSRK